ncbi:MAG: TonB-dependent receptor [Hymenobacter sp.]
MWRTLNNPNLKWETAITTDFGLDLDLLESKLAFTADYFERRTKDMIALLPVPDYVGQGPSYGQRGFAAQPRRGTGPDLPRRGRQARLHRQRQLVGYQQPASPA